MGEGSVHTEAQLDAKYNKYWIQSRRFGVRQGQKIRAVDDFSDFLVNATVSSTEKLPQNRSAD